jgi:hypothetical protein
LAHDLGAMRTPRAHFPYLARLQGAHLPQTGIGGRARHGYARADLRLEKAKGGMHPKGVPESEPDTMGSTFYSLHYHIVFGHQAAPPDDSKRVVPEAVGGVDDHVHLLVSP